MRAKIKYFIIFYFILIFLCPCFMGLMEHAYILEDMQLNPNDYARITDVECRAVVVDEPGSEGKVVITERLTFDVHAASWDNLYWELWRDLPEDEIDGVKVDYQVNSVKQIMDDGEEIIYEESPKLYWDDYDYISSRYGPGKWYHSEGPYNEDAARYECVFFYVDGLYREEVVFEIEYEMHNAALRYNDCSDLYLALYSESTINHLESYKAEILFPNEDMPAPGNYEVYTYGTNAHSFPVKESANRNPGYYTFYFQLDEEDLDFRPYNEYIEFDLVSYNEDKHIFTEYAPSNLYSRDNVLEEIRQEQADYAALPAKFKTAKTIVLFVCLVIAGVIIYYAITLKRRMQEKHMFYEPAVKMEYYRDIPSDLDPNFAAALVFCKNKPPKDNSGVYSAILLSLARKEYISLQETYNDDVFITINKPSVNIVTLTEPVVDPLLGTSASVPTVVEPQEPEKVYEPLTTCEEYYFNLLVRHAVGGSISMKTFQRRVTNDYQNTNTFARNMESSIVNIGVRDGYFQKGTYTEAKDQIKFSAKVLMILGIILITVVNIISCLTRLDFAFGGFLILGITCVACSIYRKKQAPKYLLLTQYGENEYEKWRGLYNFLRSETLMNERTFVELPLWEKYLVYATAFGLSDKVIKAISIRCPEAAQSPVLNNSYCRSGRIRYSGRSFRSAVRSGSSYARSGGGFGGFGYGGGGRGGGGGGGGH